MTVASTYDFSVNRDNLITGALRLCGVIAQGDTPTATQITEGAEALNYLVKSWQADGMPIWATTTYTVTPVSGTTSYVLTGPKPLKMLQAWNRQTASNVDIPMRILTRQEYNILGNKKTSGNPIQIYFEPNRETSTVYLFPTPDATSAANNVIYLVAQRSYADFDASTDTPDFPQEWYEAVKYGLAVRLAGDYGMPLQDRRQLIAEAKEIKDNALFSSGENGSLYFGVETRNW